MQSGLSHDLRYGESPILIISAPEFSATLTSETYPVTSFPYPAAMLPSFINNRRRHHRQTDDQPAVQRVRLYEFTREMMPLFDEIGTVEGTIGDELLVRFGEVVVQVPAEWVEAVE